MKQIAEAFLCAQSDFGPALKTNINPAFRAKYADLGACIEAVLDALHAHGIALTQQTDVSERGVKVRTVLLHKSGETLDSGWLEVPASKQDPQGYGSALTYARRYSLMAVCGHAPEDDDGNAASKPTEKKAAKDAGGAISPVKETLKAVKLTDAQKARLDMLGGDIVALWQDDDQLALLDAVRSVTDNEEKVYLWNWLASEPAIRAFIKANKE